MKKMFLIIWALVLCGCPHIRDRVRAPGPIVQKDPATPVVFATPTPNVEAPPAKAELEEVTPDRPPVLPAPPKDGPSVIVQINGELQDAFFDYDRAELRTDALSALKQDAGLLTPILHEFSKIMVIVEGHCDERGSAEYNLGLGDHRGARAAEIFREFGVPVDRIQRVSYGKERPQCTEPVESCWQRNRRVHLLVR